MSDKIKITNRDTYLKNFSTKEVDKKSIQHEALKNAIDIRKFEIELYWKRAAYFWTLIGVTYAGYFALVSKKLASEELVSKGSAPEVDKYLVLISIIGYIFSWSWFLVNKGSKFWQNNWERHVDYLEDEIIGPLYKTVKNPSEFQRISVTGAYPMSVSKINQLSSFLIIWTWIFLICDSVKDAKIPLYRGIIVIVIIPVLYICFSRSEITDKDSEEKCIFRKFFSIIINKIKNRTNKNKTDKDSEEIFIVRDVE